MVECFSFCSVKNENIDLFEGKEINIKCINRLNKKFTIV